MNAEFGYVFVWFDGRLFQMLFIVFKLSHPKVDTCTCTVTAGVSKWLLSNNFSSSGTMMCYGQTGAGKTFTMCGATESYQHRGIIPRSISQLFKDIEDRPEFAITCRFVL